VRQIGVQAVLQLFVREQALLSGLLADRLDAESQCLRLRDNDSPWGFSFSSGGRDPDRHYGLATVPVPSVLSATRGRDGFPILGRPEMDAAILPPREVRVASQARRWRVVVLTCRTPGVEWASSPGPHSLSARLSRQGVPCAPGGKRSLSADIMLCLDRTGLAARQAPSSRPWPSGLCRSLPTTRTRPNPSHVPAENRGMSVLRDHHQRHRLRRRCRHARPHRGVQSDPVVVFRNGGSS
jgi:hypothetical protein